MKNITKVACTLVVCALAGTQLSGCSTNGSASLPSTSQAPLSQNKLQLAVGTARIGQDATVGLNVVATLRQPNGLTAVLADTPTLSGPAGFTIPASMPGAYTGTVATAGPNVDAGTNHVSASPQVPLSNANLVNSTLGTFTGVFSYGFGPFNCDQNCTNISGYYPGNPNGSGGNGFSSSIYDGSSILAAATKSADPTQPLPFFSADPFDYLVGPPAVPFFNDGTFPLGFAGYLPGFTVFELPPVAGGYSLSVNVPAANAKPVTYTASATLTSTAPLGAISVAVTSATGGGMSGTVTIPTGVTETEVFVQDITSGHFYTVLVTGTGTQAWSIPATLGSCSGSGCQNGAGATPSFSSMDVYSVAAVGYDYPAFEAGPPGNTQQTPTITGANGQADITMSPVTPPATY
jgi:hypothetical protein